MYKMKHLNEYSRLLKNGINGEKIHILIWVIVTLTLMMSAPVACDSGTKPSPQDQPPAAVTPVTKDVPDGAILLDERCSVCHSANRPKQARKTADQWNTTVSRMIGKGARLTEAEKVVLLNYLGKTYGP
jgi:cytochrome c5